MTSMYPRSRSYTLKSFSTCGPRNFFLNVISHTNFIKSILNVNLISSNSIKNHTDNVISTKLKCKSDQKKFKMGMVGRQNVPFHLRWAAMLSTLRTTALKHCLSTGCATEMFQVCCIFNYKHENSINITFYFLPLEVLRAVKS